MKDARHKRSASTGPKHLLTPVVVHVHAPDHSEENSLPLEVESMPRILPDVEI